MSECEHWPLLRSEPPLHNAMASASGSHSGDPPPVPVAPAVPAAARVPRSILDAINTARAPCIFYRRGFCKKGAKCPQLYLHGAKVLVPPCLGYQQGKITLHLLQTEGLLQEGGQMPTTTIVSPRSKITGNSRNVALYIHNQIYNSTYNWMDAGAGAHATLASMIHREKGQGKGRGPSAFQRWPP